MELTARQSGDGPAAVPVTPGGRVATLDGLRGLAILGVMIFHETCLEPTTRLDGEVLLLTHLLQTGVDLFFVLSGYLITGILLDTQASRATTGASTRDGSSGSSRSTMPCWSSA